VEVKGLSDVVAMSAGTGTAYAVRRDGTVWAWGSGRQGELGDGNPHCTATLMLADKCPNTDVPVQVKGLTGAVAVAGGAFDAFALTATGTVWAWGFDLGDSLGNGRCPPNAILSAKGCPSTNVPVQVKGITDAVAISAGGAGGYALLRNGTVWSWGGAPGLIVACVIVPGSKNTCPTGLATEEKGLSGVSAVSGGATTGYALLSNGSVWAWGSGQNGALGNGACSAHALVANTCSDSIGPVRVKGITQARAISGGGFGAYALLRNGTVLGWGSGGEGQLGTGACKVVAGEVHCGDRDIPVEVNGLADVVAISAGGAGALAIEG